MRSELGCLRLNSSDGTRAGAFSCYQAALQLRPNFPQGLNNLAVIFTAQGRAQDALQMLQAAIAAAPDYAEAYNNLGVLQREVGAIKVSSPLEIGAGRAPMGTPQLY